MELEHGHAPEEIGAEEHARRAPGREDGQRQRDPAPAGDHPLHPHGGVDDGEVGSRDAAERAPGQHGGHADPAHRVAERVGRVGRLAHRAQHQPGPGPVEEPGDGRHGGDGHVHERVLAEERGADEGEVAQAGDPGDRRPLEVLPHVAAAHECGEAGAEEGEGEPGGVLVGVEPEGEPPEDRGRRCPRRRPRREAHPVAAAVEGGRETGDGGDGHHPLGSQVDHPGPLVHEQSQPGQRQRRAGRQGGGDEERDLVHRRPQRGRNWMRVSHPSSESRSTPWKTR